MLKIKLIPDLLRPRYGGSTFSAVTDFVWCSLQCPQQLALLNQQTPLQLVAIKTNEYQTAILEAIEISLGIATVEVTAWPADVTTLDVNYEQVNVDPDADCLIITMGLPSRARQEWEQTTVQTKNFTVAKPTTSIDSLHDQYADWLGPIRLLATGSNSKHYHRTNLINFAKHYSIPVVLVWFTTSLLNLSGCLVSPATQKVIDQYVKEVEPPELSTTDYTLILNP